jgi:hypothetical protein
LSRNVSLAELARLAKAVDLSPWALLADGPPRTPTLKLSEISGKRLINDAIVQLLMLVSQKAAHGLLLEHIEALRRHIQPLLITKG